MTDRLHWGNDVLTVEIETAPDAAPRLAAARSRGVELVMPAGLPLIEVLTVAQGHALANDRLVHTAIGEGARYVRHTESSDGATRTLELEVLQAESSIEATITLSMTEGVAALRSRVTVRNRGTRSIALRSVPSWSSYLGRPGGDDSGQGVDGWSLRTGLSDWLGEGRWTTQALRGRRFPRLAQEITRHNPRGEYSVVSTGTWSTGKHLPVAAAFSETLGAAWAWQIEHNGPWRWEIGEDTADGYLALSGPTEPDHQWLKVLSPGTEFTSVPVAIALAPDFTAAVGELTRLRRASRRSHPDNAAMSVVFNDYMNTLNGDPRTERLLPLIDAAAAVGAEIFCIDAGWYDDSGDWWDSVGEWKPSSTRFPGGLQEVLEHIRSAGMIPGLWLEPEVVGVNSPVAAALPDEAFLMRGGQRVVEHHRFHLDLRHPAARAHLDEVVDRLVGELGVGFFKLDYNINPGAGTDVDVESVGDGLLEHNRAHLAWLDAVLDRHPRLVLENCASGAMRADFGLLSRLQLQSTSDQQDFLKYPPIAAAAPVSMLPEQAASWAYPQPEMTEEEVAFCLATGLLGRYYLSGYLSRMSAAQLALVREAVSVAKSLRPVIADSVPFWPLGLPDWDSDWIVLGLATSTDRYLTVWNRSPQNHEAALRIAGPDRGQLVLHTVFPRALAEWETSWEPESETLRISNTSGVVGARVFRLEVVESRRPDQTPATQTL